MFGRRKDRDGVKEDGSVRKPLTVQERLNLMETGDVLLEYPAGLLQPFSRQELGRLKKRFVHLIPPQDVSRDLRLPLAKVLEMPELRAQPFVPLVAQLVLGRASGNQDAVSFSAFVTILAVFTAKQSLEVKRQVLFDVYDLGGKGCATVDDFVRVISAVSYSNAARRKATRQELQLRLATLIKQSKSDKSGVLFNDFCQIISDEEVNSALTIAY